MKKKQKKTPLNAAFSERNPDKDLHSLTGDDSVTLECTGGGKFAKSVSDHIFGHKNSNEGFAVMHIEGVSHKIGNDHGTAGPGFDGLLGSTGFFHSLDFFDHMIVHKRTFFD